jgi:hypothetical protein
VVVTDNTMVLKFRIDEVRLRTELRGKLEIGVKVDKNEGSTMG